MQRRNPGVPPVLGLPIRVAVCAAMPVHTLVVPAAVLAVGLGLAVGPSRELSDAGSFPHRVLEADQELYLRPERVGGLQVMIVDQVMAAEVGGEQARRVGWQTPAATCFLAMPLNLTYVDLPTPTGILQDNFLGPPAGDVLNLSLLAADAWRCLEEK